MQLDGDFCLEHRAQNLKQIFAARMLYLKVLEPVLLDFLILKNRERL
jgi:hypothetical protein